MRGSEQIDTRFEQINERFEQINERFTWLDRMWRAENQMFKADLTAHVDRSIASLKEELHVDRRAAQRQLLFVLVVGFMSLVVTLATG